MLSSSRRASSRDSIAAICVGREREGPKEGEIKWSVENAESGGNIGGNLRRAGEEDLWRKEIEIVL